jgi:hypothetical protein
VWDSILAPGALTLLHGAGGELPGFLQELAHGALHAGEGQVLWCDGDHRFNPYEFAELNLVRGRQADEGASRMLVKRCLTPFQWYTTLSRLLPEKVEAGAALAIVHPFDRPLSTDELADWEQEDYVRFLVPHLRAVARRTGVPIVLGVDMARWWRTHPVLAQATHDGVSHRWSVAGVGGRWRAVRDDGMVLDPELRRRVTLLDFMDERPEEPAMVQVRGPVRRPWRTRIVHPLGRE